MSQCRAVCAAIFAGRTGVGRRGFETVCTKFRRGRLNAPQVYIDLLHAAYNRSISPPENMFCSFRQHYFCAAFSDSPLLFVHLTN